MVGVVQFVDLVGDVEVIGVVVDGSRTSKERQVLR